MSEEKNVADRNRGYDKCQQINRQQGDKKELQHVPALRCNRRAAVLRDEKVGSTKAEETVENGLDGDRAVPQAALVAGDYCRRPETRGQDVCLGRVDVPHHQAGQGSRRQALHLPAAPPQAPQEACGLAHPHQGPGEHRRASCRGGRQDPLRRLGDGHHHRQGRQGRHRHTRRADYQEDAYGKIT